MTARTSCRPVPKVEHEADTSDAQSVAGAGAFCRAGGGTSWGGSLLARGSGGSWQLEGGGDQLRGASDQLEGGGDQLKLKEIGSGSSSRRC